MTKRLWEERYTVVSSEQIVLMFNGIVAGAARSSDLG
jgi:hypothetical protein